MAPTPGIRSNKLPAAKGVAGQEIASMRTQTWQTFRVHGDSYATHVYTHSVNHRDAAGAWRPIDNTLCRSGGAWHNRANRYQLSIPQNLATGPLRITDGDAWIAFSPQGASGTSTTSGPQATFREAWPGVDLDYAATDDTVREALVVSDASAVTDYSFTLSMPTDFSPQLQPSGAILIKDAAGKSRFYVAPSTMVDAGGARRPVASKLQQVGGTWTLTLSPDRAWMGASKRSWPITIDPQISVTGSLSCVISHDDVNGDDASCGGDLVAGEFCDGGSCVPFNRVLSRFDVTIPAGSFVESAALGDADDVGSFDATAYQMLVPWNDTVSWTGPETGQAWSGLNPLDPSSGGGDGDYSTTPIADITPLVRDWVSGAQPNDGVLLKEGGDNGQSCERIPCYIDPYLEIQYAPTEDPDGPVQTTATGAYAAEYAISTAEASRRLTVQDRLSDLQEDLIGAIDPSDYAGMWVDNSDNGKIKVAIKSHYLVSLSSQTSAAEAVLEAHNFQDEVEFVSVRSSLNELDTALDYVDTTLATLISENKAVPSENLSTNSIDVDVDVDVDEANTATHTEDTSITDAMAEISYVDTSVFVVDASKLPGVSDACSSETNLFGEPLTVGLECDVPMRGGVTIGEDVAGAGTRCTAGFLAHGIGGVRYLMTAGHCTDEATDWQAWSSSHTNYFLGSTGPSHTQPVDVGGIVIDSNSNWFPMSSGHTVYVTANDPAVGPSTAHDESYNIRDVRHAVQWSWVCTTSARVLPAGEHTVCGEVETNRTTQGFVGGDTRRVILISGCQEQPGTSGAPMYKNHHALGIFDGKMYGDRCVSIYTDARDAEAASGLTINTGS